MVQSDKWQSINLSRIVPFNLTSTTQHSVYNKPMLFISAAKALCWFGVRGALFATNIQTVNTITAIVVSSSQTDHLSLSRTVSRTKSI